MYQHTSSNFLLTLGDKKNVSLQTTTKSFDDIAYSRFIKELMHTASVQCVTTYDQLSKERPPDQANDCDHRNALRYLEHDVRAEMELVLVPEIDSQARSDAVLLEKRTWQ